MTTTQLGFMGMPAAPATFDGRPYTPASFGGDTYEPARDEARLTGQLAAVFEVMKDGRERSLVELATAVGNLMGRRASEAAVSARIRDLRKAQFGGHQVDHRNTGGGLWVYRLTVRGQHEP